MGKVHEFERRVEFRDTDAAGIVHFSVFFAYMEQAEHDFWRSLGTSVVHRTGDATLSWPRVSAECDYKVAIKFEQIIRIQVRVLKIGTKSLQFGFCFFRDNEQIATGKITTVCCEVGEGRKLNSVTIPEEIRSLVEPFLEIPS